MEYFICGNVFVPLRSGPSHKSEMLSQVLFGEKYRITDSSGSWLRIETLFDCYSGWIDTDHLQHSSTDNSDSGYVLNRSLLCFSDNGSRIVIEAGSEIYEPDFDNKRFKAGNQIFTTQPEFTADFCKAGQSTADTALKFLNSPYIWGGRIQSGIDCSGLTQLVYKIHGIRLPRDSYKQAETGETVGFIDEAIPGDLAFFDNESGCITHVGMILSKGLIIHASGRVRIDTIDHQGIFKTDQNRYSHRLRIIKRVR